MTDAERRLLLQIARTIQSTVFNVDLPARRLLLQIARTIQSTVLNVDLPARVRLSQDLGEAIAYLELEPSRLHPNIQPVPCSPFIGPDDNG